MPNGAAQYEHLAACPHCGNFRIRIRRRVRPYRPWRCSNCNEVFRTPKVRQFGFHLGDPMRGAIYPSEVPGHEWRSRRLRRRLRMQRLRKFLLFLAVLAILASAVFAVRQGFIALPSLPALPEEPGRRDEVAVPPVALPATARRIPQEMVIIPTLGASPAPTATPTPSPMSARTPTVRTIYAVPSDRTEDERYVSAVGNAVLSVQEWYAGQLNGLTFAIQGPTPQVCNVRNAAAYYEGKGGWDRVISDVQRCAPVSHFSDRYTWIIYIDAEFDCAGGGELGAGASGIAILHRGDLEGLASPDTYELCAFWPRGKGGWIGGLAHELGHAFGLGHPNGCDAVLSSCGDKSMMWDGFYNYPETYINVKDKEDLGSSPFFINNIAE